MKIKKTYIKNNPNKSSRDISQKMGIYEGATARTVFNLSSGAFLAGYLNYIGASASTSGKIMALPVLAAMIQFVSPIIIEKMHWKKNLVTIGSLIHRILLSSMIVIPFLPYSTNTKITLIGIIYFLSFLSVSFIMPAVTNMYMRFVPSNVRGTYFGRRESGILIFSTVVTLIMGKVLDIYKNSGNESEGYIILFSLIFLIACLNIMAFVFMHEFRERPSTENIKIRDVFVIPLKDKKFRKMIILFFIWFFGIQFGAAYFGIYMVSKLELTYTFIALSGLVAAIFYAIFASIWGKYADKNGWTKTVMINFMILGIANILWLFVFKSSFMYVLILINVGISGIAWAGLNIALFNIQFDFIPKTNKTLYLGFNAALSGIVGYGAALISSSLVGYFENWSTKFLGIEISIIQIVLSMSGLLIVCASLYTRKILHNTDMSL